MLYSIPEVCCAPERSDIPLQGRSFWESSPPMGLSRVLQVVPKIKTVSGSACPAALGCGVAC